MYTGVITGIVLGWPRVRDGCVQYILRVGLDNRLELSMPFKSNIFVKNTSIALYNSMSHRYIVPYKSRHYDYYVYKNNIHSITRMHTQLTIQRSARESLQQRFPKAAKIPFINYWLLPTSF